MVVTVVALMMDLEDWRLPRAGNPSLWGWGQAPRWRLEPPPLLPTAVHCKHPGNSLQGTTCCETQTNSQLKK